MNNVDVIVSNTEKKNDHQQGDIVKITISRESEAKLLELLEKVNDGFENGKVNRQDLASWVLSSFCDNTNIKTIEAIRADHFDEIMVLEAMLKNAKKNGGLHADMLSFIRKQAGFESSVKPKQKNP